MSLLVNFTPELSAWILHNIDRGCSSETIVNSMIEQNFEPLIARGLVAAFIQARQDAVDPPVGSLTLHTESVEYIYEQPYISLDSVINTNDKQIPVLSRMKQPVIAVLESVLSIDECDQLIDLARHRLKPSTVVDYETGIDKVVEYRDSEGMFFKLNETPFIEKLDRRISELMNFPIENGEGLQVLRYGRNAKNTPHYDFLQSSNTTNLASIARSGQRISSLVIYLNDVACGGETIFPEVGFSVLPKKGNAVYFEYTNRFGQLDLKSVHAGAEVYEGEKWVVTKWMRQKKFIPA
jgi:prolyl 4-hydroxylase